MNFLSEHLAIPRLNLPTSVSRRMLAYFHSAEVMRDFLPKLLRVAAGIGLIIYAIFWLSLWPTLYEGFERWGLVRAFFAQLIALGTVFLLYRITILRARHLETLPLDDFVVLRVTAVLCRWWAEITLIFALGMGLSMLLLSTNPLLLGLLGEQQPTPGAQQPVLDVQQPALDAQQPTQEISVGDVLISMVAAQAVFGLLIATALFLFWYAVATAIDLFLAIEFNTRVEKLGKEVL